MHDRSLLAPWVKRFLLEYLVAERNLARNTQFSYRDTLTLLPFVARRAGVAIDRLSMEDISPDTVRAFLEYVEHERGCGVVTRNQRLSAIHSLARFIGTRSPEHLAWCSEVRSIPFKKAAKTAIGYLEKPEMEALLRSPDQRTCLGARDHVLLLFLYNSGARADEAAGLSVGNLQLGTSPSVRILGKGNKWRVCPQWPVTVAALAPLVCRSSARGPCVPRPNWGADDPLWRSSPRDDLRWSRRQAGRIHAEQAGQPSHDPPHDRRSPAQSRRRHQHDSGLARTCLLGHHPNLCRSRSRDEGQSPRQCRYHLPAGGGAPTVAIAVPHGVHAATLAHDGPETYVRLDCADRPDGGRRISAHNITSAAT